jgi:RNA polymerase sigma-70 factor (ECF subfamily)
MSPSRSAADGPPQIVNTADSQTPNELSIIERVRAGETQAFELLVRRFNALVFRTARSVLRDDAQAEECAQRSWIRGFERLDQYSAEGSFPGWIGRITYREALAMTRTAKRSPVVPVPTDSSVILDGDHPEQPDEESIRREIREELEPAIDALPLPLREVFILRDVHELSVLETSQVLGLTEENIRVRHHRARQTLRARVSPSLHPSAFAFDGARCDRIVSLVLAAITVEQRTSA